MEDMPIIDEPPPPPTPAPQFDISQILGLLSNIIPTASPPPAPTQQNTVPPSTNDLLLKLLLNGNLQKMFTPKPKEPEIVRTINLDNYSRVD
jgi:hypothetical protein